MIVNSNMLCFYENDETKVKFFNHFSPAQETIDPFSSARLDRDLEINFFWCIDFYCPSPSSSSSSSRFHRRVKGLKFNLLSTLAMSLSSIHDRTFIA
jgi:hypothetical protein